MDSERLLEIEERLALLEGFPRRAYGKYRGVVVDNQGDPANAGRIKVRVPEIHGDDAAWAWPCVPYAGPQVGWFMMPPLNAGVWVEFEGGDPGKPIWVGCFWGSNELPSDAQAPDVRMLRTETAQIRVDDAAGEILLKNDSDAQVTWGSDVVVEAGGASHSVGSGGVFSESSPGKIEVGSSGVSVNSGAFKVI